jgi:hypothetical protein
VRVRIEEGAGVLDPRADRAISVSFEFQGELVAGRGYFGYWDVGGTVCTVRVEVIEAVPEVRK